MKVSDAIEKIRRDLADTLERLDRWFDLPVEPQTYKPRDGGWSIREVLEHITLTNHFLMIIIRKGRDKALKRYEQGKVPHRDTDLDRLATIAQPDAFPWDRPEHMEPTGNVPVEEVRATLHNQQKQCLDILDELSAGQGTLYRVRMSVQNLGKIDIYQWMYFLVQHQKRHLIQLEKILQEWRREKAKKT
jgi:hypothetical protein